MSKPTQSTDFDRIKPEDVPKYLAKYAEEISRILTNGVDFQTNFNGKLLSITFSAANSDTALTHNLGRVPTGYLVYSKSAALIVYDGSLGSSESVIYLRASAPGTAGVIVF